MKIKDLTPKGKAEKVSSLIRDQIRKTEDGEEKEGVDLLEIAQKLVTKKFG